MKKASLKPVYFVILGVVLGLGGFFLILANPFGWKTITPFLKISQPGTPTPGNGLVAAPPPVLILPKGKQTYMVRGGDNSISKITSVTVDPLDIKKGGTQTITVEIDSKEPITTFNTTLTTDTSSKEYSLKLIAGDSTKGTWQAAYTVSDSAEKIYNYKFNIITNNGNKTVTPFLVR